jgi:hypothetical protein
VRNDGQGDLFEGPSLESPHDLAAVDADLGAAMNVSGSDGEGEGSSEKAAATRGPRSAQGEGQTQSGGGSCDDGLASAFEAATAETVRKQPRGEAAGMVRSAGISAVAGGTAVGLCLPEVTSAIEKMIGLVGEMYIDGEDGYSSSKRRRREEGELGGEEELGGLGYFETEEMGGLEYHDEDFLGNGEEGFAHEQGEDARFNYPVVVALAANEIVGADNENHAIRVVTPGGADSFCDDAGRGASGPSILPVHTTELDRALARISALEQAVAVHEIREQEVKRQSTLCQQENIGLRQSLNTPFLHLACENVKSLMDKMQAYFECARCKALKPKSQFSNTQKNQGASVRKCITCTTPGGGMQAQR